MANGLPCPNPTCTQVFSPDAIKGASALTCPRCGTVYRFRAPSGAKPRSSGEQPAAPPQPPKPPAVPPRQPPPPPVSARPAPPPPPARLPPPPVVAAPAVPVAPVAPPVFAPPPAAVAFDTGPAVVSPRRRKKQGSRLWTGLLIFLLLGGGATAGLYFGWEHLSQFLPEGEEQRALRSQGNFAFRVRGGWKNDPDLRERLRSNVAISRTRPRSHVALYFLDTRTRSLSDAELLDGALKRLRAYFPRLEYVNPFLSEDRGRTGGLDGERAIVFPFSATDSTDVAMTGQVYTLTRRGYAYWLLFWGPESEDQEKLTALWEGVRSGFTFHNGREGWKPIPRKTVPYVTTLGLALDYADEVWEKEDNPQDADPAAELALRGYEPTEDEETGRMKMVKSPIKAATVLVLTLPRAANLKAAVAAAREHVEKQRRELNPDLKIEPHVEHGKGRPSVRKAAGQALGQVERLKLQLAPGTERYGVLAVFNRPGGVQAIFCECVYDRLEYWEEEFTALLDSVRQAKGP